MRRVYEWFKELLKLFVICLIAFAAFKISYFLCVYHGYWLNEFKQHQQVYQEQRITSQALRSQRRWEAQAEFNLGELKITHQELVQAERRLKRAEYEYYHFLRTLEKIDPEALRATLEAIKKPKIKIPFFNIIPLEPTPAECEDGQCEENFSN